MVESSSLSRDIFSGASFPAEQVLNDIAYNMRVLLEKALKMARGVARISRSAERYSCLKKQVLAAYSRKKKRRG